MTRENAGYLTSIFSHYDDGIRKSSLKLMCT